MQKRYKILVVSNYENTQSARPEAEIFLSLAKEGLDITVITQAESDYGRAFKAVGIEVLNHTPKGKVKYDTIRLIRSVVKRKDIDVLFLYNSKAIINGLLASLFLRVKTVLYRGCAGNISWYDPSMYFKYLSPLADIILCNDKAAEDLLRRQLFFKAIKAVTIRKGHQLSWYENVTEQDLTSFNVDADTLVISCVANARPVKGIHHLIEAIGLLPRSSKVQLLLIGKGLDSDKHQKLVAKHELQSKIHFLGYRSDASSFVKSSDVFVLPSLDQETLTKSVVEAMSIGTCPIISDIPGNKHLVQHQKNGLVFPRGNSQALADQLQYLMEHPEEINKLAEQAKQRIKEHLNHRETVKGYLQLITRLCDKN